MNIELEKELKQDGQTIKEVAARRLAEGDFSEKALQKAIKSQEIKPNQARWWPVGIAAAIGLVFIVTLSTKNQNPSIVHMPQQIIVAEPVLLNFKALPETIEKGLQDPLAKEQQAIIDDIKTFGKNLISI